MTKSNYGESAILTEQWANDKLPRGWYWVKTEYGFVQPVYYLITRANGELMRGFAEEPEDRVEEVLAHCDYEELKNLKQENTKLKELLRDLFKEVKDCNSQVHRINDCRRETTAYWQIESTKIALNRVETKIQSAISESEEQ